jgi:hypothetical protein
MSGKKKVILAVIIAVAALVPIIVIPCLVRASRNEALARKLHAEFDAWLASLPQIPDSENGALVILRGLELLEDLPDAYYFSRKGDLTKGSKLEQTMTVYLKRNKEALRTIEKGLDFQKWAYPVEYSEHLAAKFEHLMVIKQAADALKIRGELAELKGNWAAAWREYIKVLRLGSTLSQEPALLSRLVETAIYSTAFIKLVGVLSTQKIPQDTLRSSLELFLKSHACRMGWYETLEADYHIFSKAMADGIDGDERACNLMSTRGLMFWRAPDWQAEIETYCEFLRMCKDVEPARFYEAPREFKNVRLFKQVEFVKKMFVYPTTYIAEAIPGLARCVEKFAIAETYWRALIIMTAVRSFEAKNGRLPATLDELGGLVPEEMLTDPFSGKQLVYKLKNGDFCLYSVGVDGVDGKCEDTRELLQIRAEEGEPDDIIFHTPRKPKPQPKPLPPKKSGDLKTPRRRRY